MSSPGDDTALFSLSSLINSIPTLSHNTLLLSDYHCRSQAYHVLLVREFNRLMVLGFSTGFDRWTINAGSLEPPGYTVLHRKFRILHKGLDQDKLYIKIVKFKEV